MSSQIIARHRETHSGQFMISSLDDEDYDYTESKSGMLSEYRLKSYNHTSRLSIELQDLNSLIHNLKIAYTGKITSPKWNQFKGVSFSLRDKVRLNNMIWREYHRQYIYKLEPIVVHFQAPLTESHANPEAIILEGKYWKRNSQTISNEYQKWRNFFRNQPHQPDSATTEELLEAVKKVTEPHKRFISKNHKEINDLGGIKTSAHQLHKYETLRFENNLNSFMNKNLSFPNPRDIRMLGNADIMQPGLTQLQPYIDDLHQDVLNSLLQNESLTQMDLTRSANHLSETYSQEALQFSSYPLIPTKNQSSCNNFPYQVDFQPSFNDGPTSNRTNYSNLNQNTFLRPSIQTNNHHTKRTYDPQNQTVTNTMPTSSHSFIGPRGTKFTRIAHEIPKSRSHFRREPSTIVMDNNVVYPLNNLDLCQNDQDMKPPGITAFQQHPNHDLKSDSNLYEIQTQAYQIHSVPSSEESYPNSQPSMEYNSMDYNLNSGAFISLESTPKRTYLNSSTSNPLLSQSQQDFITADYKFPGMSSSHPTKGLLSYSSSSISGSRRDSLPLRLPQKMNNFSQMYHPDQLYSWPSTDRHTDGFNVFNKNFDINFSQSNNNPNSTMFKSSHNVPPINNSNYIQISTIDSSPDIPIKATNFMTQEYQPTSLLAPSSQNSASGSNSNSNGSEERRRISQQTSLQTLHRLVAQHLFLAFPEDSAAQKIEQGCVNISGRVSKANILQQAAQLIRNQRDTKAVLKQKVVQLKRTIEIHRAAINLCCDKFPNAGILKPLSRDLISAPHQTQQREWFRQIISSRTQSNWRWYLYGLLMSQIFDSYFMCVESANNLESYQQALMNWLNHYCCLSNFRPLVTPALCELNMTTDILTRPEILPDQCVMAAQNILINYSSSLKSSAPSVMSGSICGDDFLPIDDSCSTIID